MPIVIPFTEHDHYLPVFQDNRINTKNCVIHPPIGHQPGLLTVPHSRTKEFLTDNSWFIRYFENSDIKSLEAAPQSENCDELQRHFLQGILYRENVGEKREDSDGHTA